MHWKWIPPLIAATVAVLAWGTFGLGLVLDFERPVMFLIAIVGAFALEAIMWTMAAALGITVFQARKRIWQRITGGSRQQG